jgi:hypothetical protein
MGSVLFDIAEALQQGQAVVEPLDMREMEELHHSVLGLPLALVAVRLQDITIIAKVADLVVEVLV